MDPKTKTIDSENDGGTAANNSFKYQNKIASENNP